MVTGGTGPINEEEDDGEEMMNDERTPHRSLELYFDPC
jgi:hypothetical protein